MSQGRFNAMVAAFRWLKGGPNPTKKWNPEDVIKSFGGTVKDVEIEITTADDKERRFLKGQIVEMPKSNSQAK
jgi:hypothetical protein